MTDEKKPCLRCGGTGKIQVDEFTIKQCICIFARAMKEHLGAEIALAPYLSPSPLFVAGDPDPAVDRTKDNLFLKGYWADLLPHFKASLVGKGLFFQFKIVTDAFLKTVYVGDDSYKARAKSKRDEMKTHNSLIDIVGPDNDLVILRLGFLGYKNIAMPGILKEALMLRAAASKATWLVEDPDQGYFGPGHLAYSEDVAEDIERRFTVVDITNKKRTPATAERIVTTTEDVGMDAPPPVQKIYVERSRFESKSSDSGALGDGGEPRRPKPNWKKKQGGSGGGPLG